MPSENFFFKYFQDQLVTEMFEYLSKEAGHGQRMSDVSKLTVISDDL